MTQPLRNKVALVAGATRGAGRGIATELGAAGATVYVTGRSTRNNRETYDQSAYDLTQTIEETAEIVTREGGKGIAIPTDHLDPAQVQRLVQQIERESGHLDILVNDIWGGEFLVEWNKPVWEHNLENGLRLLRLAIDTHLITSHYALPLLIKKPGGLVLEITDGTAAYNQSNYRLSIFYDLAKTSINRLAWSQAQELKKYGCTALSLTPGWMRSEIMLKHYGVTEENWQEGTKTEPHFAISETPRFVGRAAAALAADPDVHRRNGGSVSSGELAKEYGFYDLDGSQPDAWRYLVEVQDAGKPANVTGYR